MKRVLPRDAFNDANLLKCIGQLTMLIEDGKLNLKYTYDGKPFDIEQDPSSGSTFVRNISFFLPDGTAIRHSRNLNSRELWPLVLRIEDGPREGEYYAFTEQGKWQPGFGFHKPKEAGQ